MSVHPLQKLNNLALNKMEAFETMSIEFYAPNNLLKVFWGLYIVAQAPEVPLLGPELHEEVRDHAHWFLCPPKYPNAHDINSPRHREVRHWELTATFQFRPKSNVKFLLYPSEASASVISRRRERNCKAIQIGLFTCTYIIKYST